MIYIGLLYSLLGFTAAYAASVGIRFMLHD